MNNLIVLTAMKLSLRESSLPLGICYIASYLKKKGFNVDIIDNEKNPAKKIIKMNPSIVGISSVSATHSQAIELATKLKKGLPDTKIVIGGCHITAVPRLHDCFDIGVIGEGELTMEEIVEGKPLKHIKGIVFREGGKQTINPPRPLIGNLDMLPYPSRELLDMKHYTAPSRRSGRIVKAIHILTSRGCVYNCHFCSSANMWHRIMRCHSAEYVVKEVKYCLSKYNVEEVVFIDDTFAFNIERLRKMAQLLPKHVAYTIQTRANLMDEERCELFKEMNVKEILVGLESGNPRILKYLKKGTVTIEDNRRTIELCKKYGFKLFAHIIIGSPTETVKEMMQTLELVKDESVSAVGINILTPLPATQLWDELKEKGIINDGMDLTKIDFTNSYADIGGMKRRIHISQMTPNELKGMMNLFKKELESKNFSVNVTLSNLFSINTFKKVFRSPKRALLVIKHSKLNIFEGKK